jgi:hypothetical protein
LPKKESYHSKNCVAYPQRDFLFTILHGKASMNNDKKPGKVKKKTIDVSKLQEDFNPAPPKII